MQEQRCLLRSSEQYLPWAYFERRTNRSSWQFRCGLREQERSQLIQSFWLKNPERRKEVLSVKSKTEMKNISFFIKVKFSFENVELEIDAYLLDFL